MWFDFFFQNKIWLVFSLLFAHFHIFGMILAQEAIVSEITRQTNPTGKAALVHHRRRFLQSLQKPSKLVKEYFGYL